MKQLVLSFFTFLVLIIHVDNIDAQTTTRRTTSKSKPKKEAYDIKKHLNPEVYIGNIGFFNGFYLSSKAAVGYKLSDRFTLGLGGKLFYTQFATQGKDPSLFDFGGMVFGRAKITSSIFIQAEFNLTNFADRTINFNSNLIGGTLTYPTVGLGYASNSGSNWTYNIQLLYVANSNVQDYINVVEYWVGLSYKF